MIGVPGRRHADDGGWCGLNRIAEEYAATAPGDTVTDGLAVQGEEATSAGPQVEQWLRQTRVLTR